MLLARKTCLGLAGASAIAALVGLAHGNADLWQPALVTMCVALAFGLGAIPTLATYQFTAWIVAAVSAAMIYPEHFLQIGSLDLRRPWLILAVIQLVMFGMGTRMGLRDFAGVLRMPWGVLVGVFCQFTVMPLVGFALTKLLAFPPEVAAGIVLIGCCSSGLASNVMAYLARANLPLSITLTAVATLLAPVMTPLWMKLLAGAYVEISFLKMMMDIVKIVIVPIGAALLHDYLKFASMRGRRVLYGLATACAALLVALVLGGELLPIPREGMIATWLVAAEFLMEAVVLGVGYHLLTRWQPGIDRWMPLLSMFGIIYFTAVTTAAGRNDLLHIGGWIFLAAVLHNSMGYVLGYWLSRAMLLDRATARTVALEVGLQNGGMASGLAGAMGKLGTVGLAAAVFSPWMNVSGSLLANYWRKRPVDIGTSPSQDSDATK